MDYKKYSILFTAIITAIVVGGGVYYSDHKTTQSIKNEPTPQNSETVMNDLSKPIIVSGTFKDGSLYVSGVEYELNVQDTAVIYNVPQDRLSKRVADILKEDNVKDVWAGLLSSLSDVVRNGEKLEVGTSIPQITSVRNAKRSIQVNSVTLVR